MAFTPHRQLSRARTLRREQSAAEKRLWGYLRDRRLGSHKFVRPIGPYIVDLLCRERNLIVEVDGATHSDDREVEYDARRTRFLEAEGYRVVRVQNDAVYKGLNDVLDMILMALERNL